MRGSRRSREATKVRADAAVWSRKSPDQTTPSAPINVASRSLFDVAATPPRLRRGVWLSFRLYVQSLLDDEIDQFVAYDRALNFDSSHGYRETKPSRTRAARVQEQNTAPDFRQWLM